MRALSSKTAAETAMKLFANKERNRKAALSQETATSAPWFIVGFALLVEVVSVWALG